MMLRQAQIAFIKLGRTGIFLAMTLLRLPNVRKLMPQLFKEMYKLGVLSAPVIALSGVFIGLVLGMQGYHVLVKFGSTANLGQLIALSVVRELGPVMTALLFAGRTGTALTAEIGLMKATEQLSSMEMMGVDPLGEVVYAKWWAGVLSMPLLSMIFGMVAIWGGYWMGVLWLGVDGNIFWIGMQQAVDFSHDVLNGIIKSVVFGIAVVWIAVFQGYDAFPTASGVSDATTRTVVYSAMAILALDFILTALLIGGW